MEDGQGEFDIVTSEAPELRAYRGPPNRRRPILIAMVAQGLAIVLGVGGQFGFDRPSAYADYFLIVWTFYVIALAVGVFLSLAWRKWILLGFQVISVLYILTFVAS